MATLVCALRCDKGANTVTQNVLYITPVALPSAVTVLFFSQMSPASSGIVCALASLSPMFAYLACVGTIAILALLAWQRIGKAGADEAGSESVGTISKPIVIAAVLLGIVALILRFPASPCMVVVLATLLGPLLLYGLQLLSPVEDPWIAAAIGHFVTSFACALLWVLWLLLRLRHLEWWTDWTVPFRELVDDDRISWKIAFVSWATPAGIAFELFIVALLCQMRSASFNDPANDPEYQAEDASIPMSNRESFTLKELDLILKVRQLGLVMSIIVIILWVDASISSIGGKEFGQKRENMRDEVFGIAFWFFSGVCVFIAYDLGLERVRYAAEKSKMAQQVKAALDSDWVRAGFLLAGAPILPLLWAIDPFLARLWPDIPSLRKLVVSWPWTSLITKAQWWGIAYVSFEVGGLKATTVLLAIINDALKSWPVGLVSFALFVLGTALFLLPPTPGPPVYMVTGIVITASAENAGLGTYWGVAIATAVAYGMKMAFAAIAQKGIGEPLARSLRVRRLVGVNTVEIRAIEKLLSTPTVSFGQVMILIGGPDWPAAVLCGILRLSLTQCLLATSPVLIQSVLPTVLAGALYKNAVDEKSRTLADTCLAIAGLVQMVTLALAAYVIQEVIERDYDELVVERPEDADVIALAKKEEAQAKIRESSTQWESLPACMRGILIGGLVSMEVCMVLLMGPWKRLLRTQCFRKFDFMSTVEKDLNGNPFNIVERMGWVAMAFCAVSCVALWIFNCWADRQEERATPDERASLSNDASRSLSDSG